MAEKSIIEFNEELSFGSFFKLLWIKRKFITIVVAVSLLLVLAYSFIAPYQYKTSATVLPPENSSGMGDLTSFLQTLSGGISIGSGGQANKLLLFKEIIKSREVAKIIVSVNELDKKPDFKQESIEDLYGGISSMLDVELKRSGLIIISTLTSTSYFPDADDKKEAAEFSAQLINSAISALDSVNRFKSISKARKKKEFIEKVLRFKKDELDSLDMLVEDFREEHHIFSIDDQNQAVINNAVAIGSELAAAEIELNLKKMDYDDNSPIIRAAERKYEGLLDQYRRLQQGGITPDDKFSLSVDSIPSLIRQYKNLIKDQKILTQVNLYLETQKYQEAMQELRDIPTVEALDYAQVPRHRVSPNRKVMLILTFILSLISVCSYITIRGIYRGNLLIKKDLK